MLEVLAEFTVTIPELGTVEAESPPAVVITSNRTRELHDALKRRCLYHWIEFPDVEREAAIKKLGVNPEITRFKGLGEISPDEFKYFIGEDMRLDPVRIDANESIKGMLKFFMGKNTPERQQYIIRNLRFAHDLLGEEESDDLEDESSSSSGEDVKAASEAA